MSQNQFTSLSENAFHKMHQEAESSLKKTLVLQYLGMEKRNSRDLIKLSDGNVYECCAPYKNVEEQIKASPPKINSVVEVQIIYHKKTMFIVLSVREIYPDLDAKIGDPKSYEDFSDSGYVNLDGNSNIPEIVWSESLSSKKMDLEVKKPSDILEKRASDRKPIKIDDTSIFTPLSLLDAYSRSWVARVRCTNKSDLRTYRNAKGEGSFFNCYFQDDSEKILQATFFNAVCEKFFPLIENGKVYSISQLTVQRASKFNKTNSNYELMGNKATQITEIEDDSSIPTEKFSFITIGEIKAKAVGSAVDIIGVVSSIEEPVMISLKNGDQKPKSSFHVVDDTGYVIKVDVWGECPELKLITLNQLVVLKQVVIKEFKNERNLSLSYNSKIMSDVPKSDRVKELITWRASGGHEKGIKDMKLDSAGGNNKAEVLPLSVIIERSRELEFDTVGKRYYSAVINVSGFSKKFYYDSCPTPNCMKKVRETDGGFYCDKCGKEVDSPIPRFMGSILISDHSASIHATVSSDEVGLPIFGQPVDDLKKRVLEDSEAFIDDLTKDRLYLCCYVRLMAKLNTYNNKSEVKLSILKCYPAEDGIKKQNSILLNTLKNMVGIVDE